MAMNRLAPIMTSAAVIALVTACPAPEKQSGAAASATKAGSQPAHAGSQPAGAMPVGAKVAEKGGLTLYYLKGSPEFANAKLTMVEPKGDKVEGPKVKFLYEVKDYSLRAQTEAPPKKMLANSAEGQHLHVILNNAPYMAKYNEAFEVELEDDHYVALAFLSRSYHESVKAETAFTISQFTVGDAEPKKADLTKPHMFYSRPKGTYKGKDAKRVMLDFYLVNAELSEEGMNVRATINGTEFMLSEWVPYVIEGLPMGDVTIKLELVDAEGQVVPGPFNSVERTVTLVEG